MWLSPLFIGSYFLSNVENRALAVKSSNISAVQSPFWLPGEVCHECDVSCVRQSVVVALWYSLSTLFASVACSHFCVSCSSVGSYATEGCMFPVCVAATRYTLMSWQWFGKSEQVVLLLIAFPLCCPLVPQGELQIHFLMYLYPPAAALPRPPPLSPAPVDPVQRSRSSVCITARREPPPAPSSWTLQMSGEWCMSAPSPH